MGNTGFIIALYSTLFFVGTIFILNIKNLKKYQSQIEQSTKYVMLGVIIIRYITYTSMGKYTWYLSLHICNISAILLVYYLFTYKKIVRGPLYFLSFFAIGALLQPHMDFSHTNPLYYAFIIDHVVLFFVPFYLTIVHRFHPSKKDLFMTIGILIPLMFIGMGLNVLFNENYFFLRMKPLSTLFMRDMPTILYMLLYLIVLYLGFNLIKWIGNKIIRTSIHQRKQSGDQKISD